MKHLEHDPPYEAISYHWGRDRAKPYRLVVDDGSTDRSTAIAQRYTEQHPGKVRYLEHTDHQNRGMSASRNLGIANAQGAYIAFLDADDWHHPEFLAHLLKAHLACPRAEMLATGFMKLDTDEVEAIPHAICGEEAPPSADTETPPAAQG